MHLDIGLALPQALLLVHVGRHLPPLLLVHLVLLIRSLHCIYTRRTHPPPRRREREQQSMQAGLVWQPHSVRTLSTPSCYKSIPALYYQMKGKRTMLFQLQGVIVQNSILGKYESPCKQIQNSWKFSQTERPLSNRFWTFKKYPFTFLSKIIQVLPFACICLV